MDSRAPGRRCSRALRCRALLCLRRSGRAAQALAAILLGSRGSPIAAEAAPSMRPPESSPSLDSFALTALAMMLLHCKRRAGLFSRLQEPHPGYHLLSVPGRCPITLSSIRCASDVQTLREHGPIYVTASRSSRSLCPGAASGVFKPIIMYSNPSTFVNDWIALSIVSPIAR